ncbi:MAG TPA: Stk1 family PASTA domain-containing Ser/Thr kinase [Pseudogracilibacillus sp.]|nr:Stk1 family PASTA domain-containing Ser/Thr kinase [Pseudogracilibacillus sp.]
MLIGRVLNERYRIMKTIGGGGMANVFLAQDLILDREVAIKALRMEFVDDPEFIQRFDREAQAATSLSHPNIVDIYDVGEDGDVLYMVMEYIKGSTLKEYIMKHGPLPVEEAIGIMRQLTDAIAHAHHNGLVHRDIKPQNILMDEYGNVKVTDFGIAIALSATSLTQTNSILGSVHYLSPEQARGGMATRKSDIYALGIVMYELLTGQVPFSGESPISIALKHLQNDTPLVRALHPEVPQSVENIVLQATAKDPFHRFNSVYEMEEALNVALDPERLNEPIYAPPFEAGEETKAIPIITDEQLQVDNEADTLVHQAETKRIEDTEEAAVKEAKPKKKKRFRKTKIAIATILLLIVAVVLWALFSGPSDVEIPDLVELEYDEAKEILEELNVKVNKEITFSEEIPEGYVVKTDPKAGKKVKEQTTVDVYVSNGKETITVEDYVGKNFEQVKSILEEIGFKDVKAYEKESELPTGEIMTQIQPTPNEEVVPSDTTVIFEISGGLKTESLNNLVGQTLDDAKAYAEKHELKLNVSEEHSDSVDKGKIIKQSPAANTDVVAGTTVNVTVSLGEKELPPRSHSVTFTVPFQPTEDEDGEMATSQRVEIYVEDKNETMSKPLLEEDITKDEEYTLSLVIEPKKEAKYKVLRDGKEFLSKTIPYE